MDLITVLEVDEQLAAEISVLPSGTALLVVRRSPNGTGRFILHGDDITIGRHADSAVFLDDITVSRRHACIHHAGDQFFVKDTGSLNGVYVDGQLVDLAPLDHLAELQIGAFRLVFVIAGEPYA